MSRILASSLVSALLVPSIASAGVTWNSVDRTALAEIRPAFGSDLETSNQLLGGWGATAQMLGPTPPVFDPLFERASARAIHSSNVGLGSVPWATLGGTVRATQAFPGAYGRGFAEIKLAATFTLTESTGYEIAEYIGSGFSPETEIRARLSRGTEVIFDKLFPTALSYKGDLETGSYTLTMSAWFAYGDTSSRTTQCDLRFTLPSPGAALLLIGPAFARRRRMVTATN
jgi:hypothetical protein